MKLLSHKSEEKKIIFHTTLEIFMVDLPVRKLGRMLLMKTFSIQVWPIILQVDVGER